MDVFIANFGRSNWAWPQCVEKQALVVMDDVRLHKFWQQGDKDGYIREAQKLIKLYGGVPIFKSTASRWFNLNDVFKDTNNDLWVHREKEVIWWAVSNGLPQTFETIKDPNPISEPTDIHVFYKPCSKWSDKNKLGQKLTWSGLHPRARDFLFTEGTCQKLSNSNAAYALALINGEDLENWHSQPEWELKDQKSKRKQVLQFDPRQKAVHRMVRTALDTVSASGAMSSTVKKIKKSHFNNQHEFEKYVNNLLDFQEGICALTGIPMIFNEYNDNEFTCSLDRIDSDKDYEAGNLQIVCKFANRWKSASSNYDFLRLIKCVQNQSSEAWATSYLDAQ